MSKTTKKPFFLKPPWNILFEINRLEKLTPWSINIAYLLRSFLSEMENAGEVDTAGGAVSLFKAYIDITIGKNGGIAEYKNNLIHVSTRNDIPVLLGRSPIFEDYEITFKKQRNQLIIKENKK